MVLTTAQTTAFFENDAQMALPNATVVQLQQEGISTVDDLTDFDKDSLEQVAESCRRPGGRIVNPDTNAPAGSTIPTPPFVFGAKSLLRMQAACELIKYYEATGRTITAANIMWNPVIKDFKDQWKALQDQRKADDGEVPKITKSLPVMKWLEAFGDYLHRKVGVRGIPLAYITRENAIPSAAAPPLETGKSYSWKLPRKH